MGILEIDDAGVRTAFIGNYLRISTYVLACPKGGRTNSFVHARSFVIGESFVHFWRSFRPVYSYANRPHERYWYSAIHHRVDAGFYLLPKFVLSNVLDDIFWGDF